MSFWAAFWNHLCQGLSTLSGVTFLKICINLNKFITLLLQIRKVIPTKYTSAVCQFSKLRNALNCFKSKCIIFSVKKRNSIIELYKRRNRGCRPAAISALQADSTSHNRIYLFRVAIIVIASRTKQSELKTLRQSPWDGCWLCSCFFQLL